MGKHNSEEILDSGDQKSGPSETRTMILWWEKKRLYYNCVLALGLFLGIWGLEQRLLVFGIWSGILEGFLFILAANICYTLAWVPTALLHIKSKYGYIPITSRWILFSIGLFIALVFSFFQGALMVDGFVH